MFSLVHCAPGATEPRTTLWIRLLVPGLSSPQPSGQREVPEKKKGRCYSSWYKVIGERDISCGRLFKEREGEKKM